MSNEVLLVHWPVNEEAPFKFDLSFCQTLKRSDETYESMLKSIESFSPDMILCSGWMDKDYMRICSHYHGKVPTVLSMDNHWTGSVKQQVARLVSPFTIKRAFSHAFVPGEIQKQYALKLGFGAARIKTGFYTADTIRFETYFEAMPENTDSVVRFLYLGRYVQHKGILDLWEAFSNVRATYQNCELWCVGTGEAYKDRVEGDGIKHFGFIQPDKLLPILQQCHAYILPSHFEPWGVSVHEMATAGFPLLLSEAIGAKESYLRDGENGYIFKTGDPEDLAKAMERFVNLSIDERKRMSSISRELAGNNSPEKWAVSILGFLN